MTTNRMSLHHVKNVKISEEGNPKHSEKKRDITIEQESGDEFEICVFGDFEVQEE